MQDYLQKIWALQTIKFLRLGLIVKTYNVLLIDQSQI